MDNFGVWLDCMLMKFAWYKALKEIVVNAVIAAEITKQPGSEKKDLAIKAIIQALKDFGISIPLPEPLQFWLVSTLIDLIVAVLNAKFGKDWMNKVPDIFKK